MLGKLLKYEIKSTGKVMVLLYGALLFLSMIFSVAIGIMATEFFESIVMSSDFFASLWSLGFAFLTLFFYAVIIIVSSATFIFSMIRFKNNVLGPEGYLTHTLPVKTSEIILSRCINSVLWQIISGIAEFAAITLIVAIGGSITGVNFQELFEAIPIVFAQFKEVLGVTGLVLLGILSFVLIINSFLQLFASMSIGFSFNKYKVLLSVVVYIAFNWVMSIGFTILTSMMLVFTVRSIESAIIGFLFIYVLITSLLSVLYYFITHYFLSKKLNLQ